MRRTEQIKYNEQVVTVKELTLEEAIAFLREIGADTTQVNEEYFMLGISRRELRHMTDLDAQTVNQLPIPLALQVATACLRINQDFFARMVAMGANLDKSPSSSSGLDADSSSVVIGMSGGTQSPSAE